uniref:Nad6 n=1 Tax=Laurentiella strenua TaxID=114681 RepID=A0A2I4PEQ0_9SPIT|nr:nad6 [Laurentiella strenua]
MILLNDFFLLQILILITLLFFLNTVNIVMLWYLAGIYLMFLGMLLLLNDGDILIGFLWVIDLGVGLIFFIFILHFTNFLHQKSLVVFYFFFVFFAFSVFFFIDSSLLPLIQILIFI